MCDSILRTCPINFLSEIKSDVYRNLHIAVKRIERAHGSISISAYTMMEDIVEWLYAKHEGECYILGSEWDDLSTWKKYLGFLFREFRMSG